MIAPVILSVVAFIAGHPTNVVCDVTLNGHASTQSGFSVVAWTPYGGNVLYALPTLCDESRAPLGSREFAHSLGIFIHEASHARGVRSETCAEMMADIGVFDVLRRFYNVPFFSSMSRQIGARVLAFTRVRPSEYQPEACWATGTIS